MRSMVIYCWLGTEWETYENMILMGKWLHKCWIIKVNRPQEKRFGIHIFRDDVCLFFLWPKLLVGYVGIVYYWVYYNTTLFEQNMGGGQTKKFNCFLGVDHITYIPPSPIFYLTTSPSCSHYIPYDGQPAPNVSNTRSWLLHPLVYLNSIQYCHIVPPLHVKHHRNTSANISQHQQILYQRMIIPCPMKSPIFIQSTIHIPGLSPTVSP